MLCVYIIEMDITSLFLFYSKVVYCIMIHSYIHMYIYICIYIW